MAVDKLSVSLDEDLADVVREAAAEEGVSVSAWLSAAAQDRIRNRLLRVALDELARDTAPMNADEAARLVAEARQAATVTRPGAHHAA
ncbi:MAG: ribbon-helix-helix protein, CopG family [Egibacteraceae bacterium]